MEVLKVFSQSELERDRYETDSRHSEISRRCSGNGTEYIRERGETVT